jgi:hypothetical protein
VVELYFVLFAGGAKTIAFSEPKGNEVVVLQRSGGGEGPSEAVAQPVQRHRCAGFAGGGPKPAKLRSMGMGQR